uniref:Uncharacterized protein n=1 Tax=Chlamydomonas euryale TaxID=1486919 RepID=A0A7R9Z135_9CHLO
MVRYKVACMVWHEVACVVWPKSAHMVWHKPLAWCGRKSLRAPCWLRGCPFNLVPTFGRDGWYRSVQSGAHFVALTLWLLPSFLLQRCSTSLAIAAPDTGMPVCWSPLAASLNLNLNLNPCQSFNV